MMVENEDLGLSLSLSFPQNHYSMLPYSSTSLQRTTLPSSDGRTETSMVESTRSFLKGIDVNKSPLTTRVVNCEEEGGGVSSPNSTLSSVSGKRERNVSEEVDLDRNQSGDDEDGDGDGETCRKKLRLSKDQSLVLEDTFKEHNTLNPKQKLALARQLGLRTRQVEVWFQNRRARTKLKQTEVDCEFLKRCCENLTEENRRLQKEVEELRALKLSPQFYMQMTPPTTLTMCPSCERVAVPPSSSTVHHPPSHHKIVGPTHNSRPLSINPWGPASLIQHLRPRS